MDPLLSIIVPAYNVEQFIEEAVHSALAQAAISLEVIVVDDGCSDATVERAAAIQDPRLRIVSQANRGLSGARNTGIRHARGRYVGFLDGDDAWLPERAARLVAVMEADPRIGVVFSHYAYIDEAGHPTGQTYASNIVEPTLKQMVHRNHAGSSVIGRRDCFVQAGLFDEALRSCEDYELWVRVLATTPFKFRLVPEPLALYRIRANSLTADFEGFLKNADLAVRAIRKNVPDLPERILRRGWAESYRIASRKALSSGRLDLARKHLRRALQIFPLLPAVDHRAFATLSLLLLGTALPKRWQNAPYKAARALTRRHDRLGADLG